MKNKKEVKKKSFKRLLKHKVFRKRNILSLLMVIISIMLIISLCTLDILPTKYLILIISIIIICNVISIIFINVHDKTWLKVIGYIMMILIFIISGFSIYYLVTTNNFINKSFNNKIVYDKNTYYVVSMKNNGYTEQDISNEIATYKESVNLDKALEKLNDKYPVKSKSYDDIGLLFDNLINNTDKFILIEKTSYEIVLSINNQLNRSDFVILYEFDVYTKRSKNSINKDNFNVYIGGKDDALLMDFNMIVTINKKTHTILLTSIPRDYYIEVYGKDGRLDKLSFMTAYGHDVNKESLATLFDTKIDYSIIVNTESLVQIVDYLDGIEFCSDYDAQLGSFHLVKGCQYLDGKEALLVARERNSFPGRDRIRQEHCRKIIIAIFKKMVSTNTILHYNETLNNLSSAYETDIPRDVVSDFVKDILNNGNNWKIEVQAVDGVDDHDKVHLSNMIDWVMYPMYDTVDRAKIKIKETLE